jgi:hypothetical protein
MAELDLWVVPITVTVGALVLAVLLSWAMRTAPGTPPRREKASPRPAASRGTLTHTCQQCHQHHTIPGAALQPISGFEKALVVRSRPTLTQRNLAEFVCPTCEAVHCFARNTGGWEWVGANLYTPHHAAHTRCAECGSPLAQAPPNESPPEDARLALPGAGLRCARCGSAVCYACLARNTRGYQPGGVLICPRCARPAVVTTGTAP